MVDSRRTIGTWFFGGALIVLFGSNQAMPPIVRLLSNVLWGALALGVLIDSILISRKIKRLVASASREHREARLALLLRDHAVDHVRRMRAPAPRVNIGDQV
ncbi:DUF3043 domain-containing protein [Micromonospora sp. b486]|uniref:DUF3043 domain-containing protein n=1 Tax=Micromonospora sp. b486 TaxID=3053986 RepID=UPI00259CFB20|nr:DUF3043 domain-containing protein [Micromonospora sp. b486]MDM4784609.1 DUF3043 domain-containing protein [Micromonospora sp. b486]